MEKNNIKKRRVDKKIKRVLKTFRLEENLLNQFIKTASDLGYNTTEALEIVMQKTIEGLLPRKEITAWVGSELKVNAKPFTTSIEVNEAVEKAITTLKDYLAKENQLENVIQGPSIQEIFGSLKVYAGLKTGEVIAVDVETQELQFIIEKQESGETKCIVE